MMSEKRYSETERNCYYTSLVFDNQTQEELGTPKVVVMLNELVEENEQLKAKASSWKITCSQEINEKNVLFMKNRQLQEENEQLRKQIQNYKQLIASSYEGEEERLDGFIGKYVIWEDELQKMIK